MIEHLSKEKLHRAEKPTEDDLEFLMYFADADHGKVKGEEIIASVEIWSSYLARINACQSLLKDYDTNNTGMIEEAQLTALLQEGLQNTEKLRKFFHCTPPARKVSVPPEVVHWIFEESKITEQDGLSAIEIARATACWYVWLEQPDPFGDPGRLKDDLKDKEERNLPGPLQSSACCTVS